MGYTITNILVDSVNSSVEYNYVDTWGYGDETSEEIERNDGPFSEE